VEVMRGGEPTPKRVDQQPTGTSITRWRFGMKTVYFLFTILDMKIEELAAGIYKAKRYRTQLLKTVWKVKKRY
jgi:hypothetical protein